MRTRIKFTAILIFTLTALISFSQTVTIPASNAALTGAGNSLKRKPLGSYYGYERSAFIYTSSELGITDTSAIQSIAFFVDSVNSFIAANTPVKVYLKEISNSVFSASSSVADELNAATLVFNGNLAASSFSENAWTTITFTNAFVYNPANNLEVIIETNAGGAGNEGQLSKGFRYNTASAKRFQFWQQDNSMPAGTGTLDTLRPNITINYTAAAMCSGTPAPGIIVASDTAVCSGNTVDLTLQGNGSGWGLQYVWQYSTDSVNWTSVSGQQSNYTAQINGPTYFQCTSVCFLSSAVTPVIKVNTLLPVYCYCTTGIGGGCSGYSIDSVSIDGTTFNAALDLCENNAGPHYSQYGPTGNYTADLTAGQTYTMTVRETGNNSTSLWIDYDHDGYFESTEWEQITTSTVTNGLSNATFTVPFYATNGLTGMRLRTRASGILNDSTNACTNFASGETEDFLITINGGWNIGLNEQSKVIEAVVYPNPSKGSFTIETNGTDQTFIISITDMMGRNVHQSIQRAESGRIYMNPELNQGMYLIHASDVQNKGVINKRIIIE